MDFALSATATEHLERLQDFMDEKVYPAEAVYEDYRREAGYDDHTLPHVVEELKVEARKRGLWNLFLPDVSGLSNLDYASLAEPTGWSIHIAPEALNTALLPTPGTWRCCTCSAPPSRRRSGCNRSSRGNSARRSR